MRFATRAPRRALSLAAQSSSGARHYGTNCADASRTGLRVGVVGLGAVGTIFFTQLGRAAAKAPQLVHSVDAIVKPHHLAALAQQRHIDLIHQQENKIAPLATVSLKQAPNALVGTDASVRIQTLESDCRDPLDVVLVTLKAYDSARVVQELQQQHAHRFQRDAVFLLLQNGLGARPPSDTRSSTYQYANGVTYIGGRVESIGRVFVSGFDTEPTYFAPTDPTANPAVHEKLSILSDALVLSGLKSQVLAPHKMQTILWRKLIVNAAINPIAAVLDVSNGSVGACEWSRRGVEAVVREAMAVAKREHVDLQATEEEMVTYVLRVAANTSANVCSTLADLRKGARTEIDAITGQLIQHGAKHGVPTPVNSLLLDLVKTLEGQQLRVPKT